MTYRKKQIYSDVKSLCSKHEDSEAHPMVLQELMCRLNAYCEAGQFDELKSGLEAVLEAFSEEQLQQGLRHLFRVLKEKETTPLRSLAACLQEKLVEKAAERMFRLFASRVAEKTQGLARKPQVLKNGHLAFKDLELDLIRLSVDLTDFLHCHRHRPSRTLPAPPS